MWLWWGKRADPLVVVGKGMEQNLGGYIAAELLVMATIDFPHTAAAQLLLNTVFHIDSALRELGQHVRVDVGNLGNPMLQLLPPDSETTGQLGPQPGVIQSRQGALVELDGPGIQCQPATIGGFDPIGDHCMGVQLWIQFSTGVLPKHRHHTAATFKTQNGMDTQTI